MVRVVAAEPSALTPADLGEVERTRWYHSIELAPGVVTAGWFDTRQVLRRVPMPVSLAGKRCLDVGTYDGFWAFEMERRGATSTVALDVLDPDRWDWPADATAEARAAIGDPKRASRGFEIARAALGSAVERVDASVYDLDPDVHGSFDFVYLGSLLLHLRDPILALERVRSVCDGELVVTDAVDISMSLVWRGKPAATLDGRGRPWWWKPNAAALRRMVESAGFDVLEGPRSLYVPFGAAWTPPRVKLARLLSPEGREAAILRWRGDPHATLRARPC